MNLDKEAARATVNGFDRRGSAPRSVAERGIEYALNRINSQQIFLNLSHGCFRHLWQQIALLRYGSSFRHMLGSILQQLFRRGF
ncbi:hypothetical protein CBM2626_A50007 [Cupriavidus taiwanensis]|nr:hypothetical protein CBM2626_A50007 [Cupriavidus taiwanensis]